MKTQEKAKKKLIFSSDITAVSNYTANEITLCPMQQTEICASSPVTLDNGVVFIPAPPMTASVHRNYSAKVIIYLIY